LPHKKCYPTDNGDQAVQDPTERNPAFSGACNHRNPVGYGGFSQNFSFWEKLTIQSIALVNSTI
jgi:hypothetical protein